MKTGVNLTNIALRMLRASPEHLEDARQGAKVNNSVVGGVISMTHRIPRWAAEQAVREALAIIEEEDDRSQKPLPPLAATDDWRKLVARTWGEDE